MDVAGSTPVARSRVRRCRNTRGAAVGVACLLLVALGGCGGRSRPPAPRREPTAIGRLWDEGRHGLGVALRHPADVITPAPPDARGRPWVYCTDALAEHGVDVDAENAAASPTIAATAAGHALPHDVILVPGYTPVGQREPNGAIHPVTVGRLELARRALDAGRAPLVVVSGGNVHPPHTTVNEALQMKRWLLDHGVPEARIVVEPCARHSHTNLRNAGRFLLVHGLSRALVVTSADQAMYFGRPRTSSFDARCLSELGYVVGDLREVDANTVTFVPSGRTLDRGPDPLDP